MIRACVIFCAILATPVLAEDRKVDCDNPMIQSEMNFCAYEAWQQADEELNETYGWALEVSENWSLAAQDALRDAQRAWVPYRDAACAAEGFLFEGGSMQPLIVYSCKEHLTRQRTQEMRAVYEMN